MAKFAYFEISCGKYEIKDEKTGNVEKVVADSVSIQISKKVNLPTMCGEKSEFYKVPISDIPVLFLSDVKIPAMAGEDCTARISAVKDFLSKYVGKSCSVEQITKGNRSILTYIEFD